MASWIDPMRQKILIAPHLPENIVLFRLLEARRIAMRGRPPAPAGGKRHGARHLISDKSEHSAAIKAAWARPEVRAKVMASLRAHYSRRRAVAALLRGIAEALRGI